MACSHYSCYCKLCSSRHAAPAAANRQACNSSSTAGRGSLGRAALQCIYYYMHKPCNLHRTVFSLAGSRCHEVHTMKANSLGVRRAQPSWAQPNCFVGDEPLHSIFGASNAALQDVAYHAANSLLDFRFQPGMLSTLYVPYVVRCTLYVVRWLGGSVRTPCTFLYVGTGPPGCCCCCITDASCWPMAPERYRYF
jgi:hypothetical protein